MDEDKMKKESGELDEDELDSVGGGCSKKRCPICGSENYLAPVKGRYRGRCYNCEERARSNN